MDLPDIERDSCDTYHRADRLGDLRDTLLTKIERKTELVERVVRDADWDLVFAVYGASHCVGHQCWHLHDASHPLHDPAAAALGDPIVEVYEALDAGLGRLCDAVGSDTDVALVLSHGMGPHYDGAHLLDEILRRIEDATLGPPASLTRFAERARRKVARLRRGRRTDEGHADGSFARSLDGSRRVLRAPNSAPVGCVKLNVKGREPRGKVRAGSEYEELIELLRRELLALVDPIDGEPLVTGVRRVAEVHAGPFAEQMGDLFVEWRRDRPITAAASPTIGVVQGEYRGIRTGDHHAGGLLVVAGPGVDRGGFEHDLEGAALSSIVSGWLRPAVPERDPAPAGG